ARVLHAVVASADAALDTTALQDTVKRTLPVQLWPAHVSVLSELPRTLIGKLDRRKLHELPLARRAHRAPETALQHQLAALFAELLSVDEVGLDDEFFELGGDSLLAMRLCARVKRELSVSLSLPALFDASSLSALADHVSQLMPNEAVQEQIEGALSELL